MLMSDKIELILNATEDRDGKKILTCSRAVKLSSEHDISLKEIGELCDAHGIKIRECRLGCF